eukprot:821046-Prorocentrum_minimum.AAC.1
MGNWTQGEKRGSIFGVVSAPLPLLAQQDPAEGRRSGDGDSWGMCTSVRKSQCDKSVTTSPSERPIGVTKVSPPHPPRDPSA